MKNGIQKKYYACRPYRSFEQRRARNPRQAVKARWDEKSYFCAEVDSRRGNRDRS
jgi:hypothetical protein